MREKQAKPAWMCGYCQVGNHNYCPRDLPKPDGTRIRCSCTSEEFHPSG